MLKRARKTKPTSEAQKKAEAERLAADDAAAQTHGAELLDEMDDLLDEVDGILEENAELFMRGYVQKGGE